MGDRLIRYTRKFALMGFAPTTGEVWRAEGPSRPPQGEIFRAYARISNSRLLTTVLPKNDLHFAQP